MCRTESRVGRKAYPIFLFFCKFFDVYLGLNNKKNNFACFFCK